ncbi:MAG: GyrI-like domain-containing protein [Eisenbergiella massiliensis]
MGEGLSVERIAANTWVVFEGTGPAGAFQELQKKVYSEFFPGSEYRPLSGMDIQVYPQGDMQSPQYRCELWIPVETDK